MKKFLLCLLIATAQTAAAEERGPLWNIGGNFWQANFNQQGLAAYALGGAATYVLVASDADAKIQRWANKHDEDLSLAWSAPGLAGGAAMPLLLPGGMMLYSDAEAKEAAAAAWQAAGFALAASSVLKAITNRRESEEERPATNEQARDFQWGFLRQSVWNGWPSGHAATNMAMGAALAAYYEDRPGIQAAAYGWAAYVAASAALGDRGGVHWASDAVAGSIIGWAIGNTVGKQFRHQPANGGGLSVQPDLQNNGVTFSYRF